MSDANTLLSPTQRDVMQAIVDAKGTLTDAIVRAQFDEDRAAAEQRVENAKEGLEAKMRRLEELNEFEKEQLKAALAREWGL